jgi:transcriptional regulator with XRE-family HTH domain
MVSLNSRAFAAGFSMSQVLSVAGVAGSTWSNWRLGKKPQEKTLALLNDVLDRLIAEDEAAEHAARDAAA